MIACMIFIKVGQYILYSNNIPWPSTISYAPIHNKLTFISLADIFTQENHYKLQLPQNRGFNKKTLWWSITLIVLIWSWEQKIYANQFYIDINIEVR